MKAEGIFGIFLSIMLMLAMLLYVSGYTSAIANDTSIDNATKSFVSFTPTLLGIGIFVLSALLIVVVAKTIKEK